MEIILLSIASYLWGNINPAIIWTRVKKGIDIRGVGRQNAGATNAALVLGIKAGVMIMVLDIFKGVFPVLLARLLYPETDAIWFLLGVMTLLGHIFPVIHQFKGGKGTASLIGVLITAAPLFGVILLSLSLALLAVVKYVTLPTVLAVIVTPVYLFFSTYSLEATGLMVFYMMVSLFVQRKLIMNMIQGSEVSLKEMVKDLKQTES